MSYSRLYIFIEGPDDRRFFEIIIEPQLSSKYDCVEYILYQWEKHISKEHVVKFLRGIYELGADYLFISDFDDGCPCVTRKKQEKNGIYGGMLIEDNIVVVVKEIEGWYFAGLEDVSCEEYKISKYALTDDLTKEDFEGNLPKGLTSTLFMLEILKHYSLECAVNKNKSFKYFIDKFVVNA